MVLMAIETYDEIQRMEYFSAVALASLASGLEDGHKHVFEHLSQLQDKYFPNSKKERKSELEDDDTKKAFEFIKSHAVRIDTSSLEGAAVKPSSARVKSIKFTEKPKGGFID